MTEPHHNLLDELLDAERRAPGPSSAQQARVRAAIATTVAAAAVTGAAVATTGSVASSTTAATVGAGSAAGMTGFGFGSGAVVVAALAATVGGGVLVSRYEPAPAVVDVVTVTPPAPPPGLVVPPEAPVAPASVPAPPPPVLKPASRPTTAVVVAQASPDPLLLAAERDHLARVRTAMNAGELETALQLLQVHVVSWPQGQLVEEREALTVLCLARLGRVDSARDAARAFVKRWPQSLFRNAIEQASH